MQQQIFDLYATNYDDHFTFSQIGIAQRTQVYKHLAPRINFKNAKVLEVNCGTGEDAIWMTQKGASVAATDVSNSMIKVAKAKVIGKSIDFVNLDLRSIDSFKPEKFDLIFSNFGGLNCLNRHEFMEFANKCSLLQNTTSKLAFVIMSERCLWEKFYYTLKGDVANSVRRLNKQGADTSIDNIKFKTYYYSPSEIQLYFSDKYKVISKFPIGLCVPPSYLDQYFKKRKWLFNILSRLDAILTNFSIFSNYADHYLIILEKK